ncbi:hypothetical protein BJX66DRAFT_306132 [Aspergillus keveii]|uniref:Protein kinase domain-containing protein n=1 Tax=Aspergillus keveii TaxID=714993 RepID=A0ABR4G318_9EURO
MITPPILFSQMREMATNNPPERWQEMADTIYKIDEAAEESPGPNLQEWLHDVYFGKPLSPELSREIIEKLGQIIARLLCFEPSARASAREVLQVP